MTDKNNSEDLAKETENAIPEVHQEYSKVASSPKKNILIFGLILSIAGYIIYSFFFTNNTNTVQEVAVTAPQDVIKPAENSIDNIPAIPQLPEPPKLETPKAPEPPPTLEVTNKEVLALPIVPLPEVNTPPSTLPIVDNMMPPKLMDSEEEKRRKLSKRKSAIILISGNEGKKTLEQIEEELDFKKRGNMDFVLGKGKIIDVVVETALDTDLGGEIRALVSRDIYSENRKIILVPKGSRVFGTYTTSVSNDMFGRIKIDWNRIDLISTGYTVNLQGTGIDNLGRNGSQGRLDSKYKERITNSILSSAFSIALAKGLDQIVKPVINSQESTQNTAIASQLNNLAFSIAQDTSKDNNTKIRSICAQIPALIPDKTSIAYTSISTACTTSISNPNATNPAQTLQALVAAVNSASASMLTTTATLTTPTQAQNASKDAFKDLTKTIKEITIDQQLKPTITIAQGTPIRIFVNKDYKFPKDSVIKSKVVK